MGQARAAAIDLYFLDESGFAPTLPPGYTWARMGTRAIVPYVAPQGRRVNVIGALAPHGPQPRLAYQSRTGKIDSVAFLEFLWRDVAGLPAAPDRLPPGYHRGRPCVIVLDNYSVHRSAAVKECSRPWPRRASPASICRPIRPSSTPSNQDQINAGAVPHSAKSIGRIMVVHSGHPLVGRTFPVVRRYSQRGERHWVIELPDGSRQYILASWCTPLTSSPESPHGVVTAMTDTSSSDRLSSPLNLSALRDLATVVRALQEVSGSDGGAHEQGLSRGGRQGPGQDGSTWRGRRIRVRRRGIAAMGELRRRGSPGSGERVDPPGAAARPPTLRPTASSGEGVRQP